jgi:nucleoid DNA-binding protein
MAENKLSWTELRRALATRAGVSEKEANLFLSAFNAQLIEALKADKQVKINGLGIFRLQAVAPRKSVNVTTGEEIIIEGYNKIAFMPEAGVKELVEKSGERVDAQTADSETEAKAMDPIQKLGAQAEEIVDILGELGQSPKEEAKEEVKGERIEEIGAEPEQEAVVEPEPEPVVEQEPVVEPEPVVEQEPEPEPVVETEPEPVVEQEPVVEPEPEPVVEPEPEPVVEEPEPEVENPKKKKKYHFVRDILICVVLLLMLLFTGYFFMKSQLSSWLEEITKQRVEIESIENEAGYTESIFGEGADSVSVNPEIAKQEGGEKEIVIAEEPKAVEKKEEPKAIEQKVEKPKEVKPQTTVQPKTADTWRFDDILLTEEITPGSRLTWIAKKHYGDKIYWPYLYEANKDHISNPSNIPVGTPIRVPRLTKAMRDTTDARFIEIQKKAYKAAE